MSRKCLENCIIVQTKNSYETLTTKKSNQLRLVIISHDYVCVYEYVLLPLLSQ